MLLVATCIREIPCQARSANSAVLCPMGYSVHHPVSTRALRSAHRSSARITNAAAVVPYSSHCQPLIWVVSCWTVTGSRAGYNAYITFFYSITILTPSLGRCTHLVLDLSDVGIELEASSSFLRPSLVTPNPSLDYTVCLYSRYNPTICADATAALLERFQPPSLQTYTTT